MEEKQVGSLFLIAAELTVFIGGVLALIYNSLFGIIVYFGASFILPAFLFFNFIGDELKNSR